LTTELPHLSSHHRDTILQLFQHPTSHNIEWHDVLSLLEATGTVDQRHDGKYHVQLGDEVLVIVKPKHDDIDVQQVVDLRRIFTAAGYDAVVRDMEAHGKED
jgi:glyceraldehyde-3-phosphate dehydrogenase/erythrose-4-phosphate dehydrogenase